MPTQYKRGDPFHWKKKISSTLRSISLSLASNLHRQTWSYWAPCSPTCNLWLREGRWDSVLPYIGLSLVYIFGFGRPEPCTLNTLKIGVDGKPQIGQWDEDQDCTLELETSSSQWPLEKLGWSGCREQSLFRWEQGGDTTVGRARLSFCYEGKR